MKSKIALVTGATGFVGKKLCLELLKNGYQLRILSRNKTQAKESLGFPGEYFEWEPDSGIVPVLALKNTHVVFHLAGESIASGRWSAKKKLKIWNSRVLVTKSLVDAMAKIPPQERPNSFVSSSAIGIYGNPGDAEVTEQSKEADTFLAKLCREWEHSAFRAQTELGIRTVCLRIGIVLGLESGALKKMLPIFRMGFGGRLGLRGNNWMSWIHVNDLVNLFIFASINEKCVGSLNAVSTRPIQNKVFTKTLSQILGRPALAHAPSFLVKLLLGEMSTVVLSSQRVVPKKALELDFKFNFDSIESCLKDFLQPAGQRGASVLEVFQWFPKSPESIFPFFADANNLEQITPPYLNFAISSVSTTQIQQGTLIRYSLRVRGLPIKWKTLIESYRPPHSFVDKQLKGPYSLWHHTHTFEAAAGGTLASDRVLYKVGWGILGDLISLIWVDWDVQKIFEFRKKTLKKIFGSP